MFIKKNYIQNLQNIIQWNHFLIKFDEIILEESHKLICLKY